MQRDDRISSKKQVDTGRKRKSYRKKRQDSPPTKQARLSKLIGIVQTKVEEGEITTTKTISDRPPTADGSKQGDHVSAYRLITYVMESLIENLNIDEAIECIYHFISSYCDKSTATLIAEEIKLRIESMKDQYFIESYQIMLFEQAISFAKEKEVDDATKLVFSAKNYKRKEMKAGVIYLSRSNIPGYKCHYRYLGHQGTVFEGEINEKALKKQENLETYKRVIQILEGLGGSGDQQEPQDSHSIKCLMDMTTYKETIMANWLEGIEVMRFKTRGAYYRSNVSYLKALLETLCEQHVRFKNKQLYTSFPTDGNEAPRENEGSLIKNALNFLVKKSEQFELLNGKTLSEIKNKLLNHYHLGPRQFNHIANAMISDLQKEGRVDFETITDVFKTTLKDSNYKGLSKPIQNVLNQLGRSDLQRVLLLCIMDKNVTLEKIKNVPVLNIATKSDFHEIAKAMLDMFWYPKVRDEVLIQPKTARWEQFLESHQQGVKPRNNDVKVLYEVVANHLFLVFSCFQKLADHFDAISHQFLNLVGYEALNVGEVSVNWGFNQQEMESFRHEVFSNKLLGPFQVHSSESASDRTLTPEQSSEGSMGLTPGSSPGGSTSELRGDVVGDLDLKYRSSPDDYEAEKAAWRERSDENAMLLIFNPTKIQWEIYLMRERGRVENQVVPSSVITESGLSEITYENIPPDEKNEIVIYLNRNPLFTKQPKLLKISIGGLPVLETDPHKEQELEMPSEIQLGNPKGS